VFSGSVLVAERGRVLLAKGYGEADVAHKIANTVNTEFRIGSISKQFAAMAILQLQDAGKLSIHDYLCRYVAACPKAWGPITLQQLLTHTSGFPTNYNVPGLTVDPAKSISVPQGLALIKRVALDRAPGAGYEYSNLNFDLLGMIVEKIAHEPYATYLRQQILDPLLLQNTGYDTNHPNIQTHASGYSTWQHPAPFVDLSWYYAAGALYSNVVDLLHWDQALAAGVLISKASTADMMAAHVTMCTDGAEACGGYDTDAYGYGLVRSSLDGHTVIWHNGEVSGFKATNAFLPDDGITVIVLSNLESSGAADIIGTQLIDMMLGRV
jgi:CubicO group peptidase (beta-lactamase class C family)